MFFISGEEIAWGQRLLGLETPEKLEAGNLQGEITLHNIIGVLGVINLVMMLISGGAAAAFFVNQKIHVEQYWKGADFLFVPPFFLVTSFLIMFLYRLFRRLVWRDPGFTTSGSRSTSSPGRMGRLLASRVGTGGDAVPEGPGWGQQGVGPHRRLRWGPR